MAHAKLPDEKIQEIVALARRGVGVREIGRRLGVNASTASRYVRQYSPTGTAKVEEGEAPPTEFKHGAARDDTAHDGSASVFRADRPATVKEIMEACQLDPLKWVAQYYKPNAWQGFYKLNEAGAHRKVNLYQSKAVFKRVMSGEMENAILAFVREHVRPAPLVIKDRPRRGAGDYAVSWGIWDAHIGLYAWQSEVNEDFDLSIAVRRVKNSVDDMLVELMNYSVAKIWMPVGNDFMHFDSVRHTTAFGEHFLDTDTRFAKVYMAALQCLAYMVDRALEICDDVEIIYVPGNHDMTVSFTLCAALAERYRDDKRVKADLGANPRKYRMHGGTLMCYDHGRDCKPDQYALIFGTEAKEFWSRSTYREVQIGDKHQRWEKQYEGVIPTNGLLVRRNPSLCNVDAWHHRQGLIGEPVKSVEAWRYDEVGYRGSHVAWARDDNRKE